MSRRVRFRARAASELAAAIEWLEEQRAGRGARLLAEIDRTLLLIYEAPKGGALWPGRPTVRTWRVRRFPYSIVYVVTEQDIEILAVAHQKRRPAYWER